MKTKLIRSCNPKTFEKDVADFLNSKEVNEIISLKYDAVKGNNGNPIYTALVIYK